MHGVFIYIGSKSLKLSSIIVEGFEYDLLLEQPFLMQTVFTGTIGGLCRGILNDQPFFLPFSESPVSTRLHKETEDSVLTHPSDNDILHIGMRRLENLRVRPCLSSNPVYSSSCFSLQQGVRAKSWWNAYHLPSMI